MNRWAIPVASAVAVGGLLGACGDDGSTTIAKGEDVQLVGDEDLGGQTLDIEVEEDVDVTGEVRFTDADGEVIVAVECADTETDGVVIVGGTVTESSDDDYTGQLLALFIREGDPDSVAVWINDDGENETCTDLLVNRRDLLDDESLFVSVENGSNIETG